MKTLLILLAVMFFVAYGTSQLTKYLLDEKKTPNGITDYMFSALIATIIFKYL